MGTIDIATIFYLLQLIQPIFSGVSSFAGGALQFLFLLLDLGTFWLGFV